MVVLAILVLGILGTGIADVINYILITTEGRPHRCRTGTGTERKVNAAAFLRSASPRPACLGCGRGGAGRWTMSDVRGTCTH